MVGQTHSSRCFSTHDCMDSTNLPAIVKKKEDMKLESRRAREGFWKKVGEELS